MTKWADDLGVDADALEEAVRREERRGRALRSMAVEDVQILMQEESSAFARVLQARRKLKALLDGKGTSGTGVGGSGGAGERYVKHRQEGHIPEALVTAYEALWLKTYGSEASVIGDPSVIRGIGKGNTYRTGTSGEKVARGGARGSKDRGGARKSIIKHELAFHFKRKMDKRMRRLAKEIEEWLVEESKGRVGAGGVGGVEVSAARCARCFCFMERDWRYCARCGAIVIDAGDVETS